MNKRKAFTVAEMLITLVVIGVIAAITVPWFIDHQSIKINDQRNDNIVAKMKHAVGMMRANGELDLSYASTDDFVDSLQKYLKINKRCNSNELDKCWPTKTVTKATGETFEIKNAKTRSALGFNDDYGSNQNVGLILADGTHMILTYNPGFQGVAMGDMVSNSMEGLAFIMNV